jgi:hypothetical protein
MSDKTRTKSGLLERDLQVREGSARLVATATSEPFPGAVCGLLPAKSCEQGQCLLNDLRRLLDGIQVGIHEQVV